jgi:ABC-2 type transport system ATP-binding protein
LTDDVKPAEASALSVETVSHAYGARQALQDVSFTIEPGRFTVLLGLNGAGKSTLFSLVTRLYATRTGQIRIFGHDVRQAPGEALRLLGVVFQSRTLDLDLTVLQNMIYHAALHGIGRRAARERARQVLTQVMLADREGEKVRNLSGASRSLGRCFIILASFCSTSRPSGSTSRPGPTFFSMCAGWSPISACRSSGRPT